MKDGASAAVSRTSKKAGAVRPPARSHPSFPSLLPALLMFAVAVALYAPASRNGFIYDDTEVILHHEEPRSFSEFARIFAEPHFPGLPYYRPVTRATLLLQKTWHGADAAPFHWFNALLMGVAGVLAFLLLRLQAFGIGPVPALLAAALFALHPLASSCVYPISSGRETLLPSAWTLAAMYGWLRPGRGWRTFAVIAFAAGLLSKEQGIAIPVLFVLADWLALTTEPPPGTNVRKWLTRYAPIVLILIGYFAVRQRLFGGSQYGFGTLSGPLVSAAYALQTLAAPFFDLVYEPSLETWWSPPRMMLAIIAIGGLIAAAWRLCGPDGRVFFFWVGWFGVTLLPTSNLLRQEAFFDERYVFLPSLAILAMAAAALSAVWQIRTVRLTAVAGFGAAIVCAAGISYHRAAFFADDIEFSRQWLRSRSTETGSLPRGVADYFLQPAHTKLGVVNAHYNLAYALAQRGDYQDAVEHYSEALSLRPDYIKAHNNLANALAALGRTEEAASHFSEALRLDPGYPDAHFNLGSLLARQGKLDDGISHLTEALRLALESRDLLQEVDVVAIRLNLANALALSGRLNEAHAQVVEALRIRPESADAHNNLGNILVAQKRLPEAADEYRKALGIRPDHEDARRNLALVEGQVQTEQPGARRN